MKLVLSRLSAVLGVGMLVATVVVLDVRTDYAVMVAVWDVVLLSLACAFLFVPLLALLFSVVGVYYHLIARPVLRDEPDARQKPTLRHLGR